MTLPGKIHPLIAITFASALAFGASSANAANFVVTRADDPAPDGCLADDCSLREAVDATATTPEDDTIVLGSGQYQITLGEIAIDRAIAIRGAGSSATLVTSSGDYPILHVVTFGALTFEGAQIASVNDSPVIVGDGGTATLRDVHVPATSNTAPAALLAQWSADRSLPAPAFDAALVPPAAVGRYGLSALADEVSDNPSAQTRFVVVGHPGQVPAPTGTDKTTLVVHLPDNESGALMAMLEQFSVRGVNLSRIESRPIGDEMGRYSFSLDVEGHIRDERVGEAVMGLHRRCPYVRFLGSYPRADAVAPTVHVGTSDADFVGARTWLQAIRAGQAT